MDWLLFAAALCGFQIGWFIHALLARKRVQENKRSVRVNLPSDDDFDRAIRLAPVSALRWEGLSGNVDIARGVPTDQMADNTATPAREDQVYDKALERLTQWESNPEERQALVDDDIEPPTPEAIKRAKKSIYRLQARQGKGWPPITFKGVGMGSDGEVCVYYRVGRFDIDERAFKTGMVEIFAFENATHKLVAVYDWYGYCMRGPVGGHIAVQGLDPYHKTMVNLFDAIRQEGQKWDFNKARGAFPWKPGDPTAVQIIDEMRGE